MTPLSLSESTITSSPTATIQSLFRSSSFGFQDVVGASVPPASQGPVVPIASRVHARVIKYSIWEGQLLSPASQQTIYSLLLDVCGSQPQSQEMNPVSAGDRLETFSTAALAVELFGRTITATLRNMGDERGSRFWIRDLEIVEGENPCGDQTEELQ